MCYKLGFLYRIITESYSTNCRKTDKSACLKHILRRGRANLNRSVKVKIYLPPPNMDFNVTNITLLYKIPPENEKQVLYT